VAASGTAPALLAVLGPSARDTVDLTPTAASVLQHREVGVRLETCPSSALGTATHSVVEGIHAAADAAIYYRGELRRRLGARGVTPRDETPASLAAAAYLAWGEGLATWLEGDMALLIWDSRRRKLIAARDFIGRRPLYYARLTDGGLAVSSSVQALLALEGCPTGLSAAALAGVAAGLPESPWDSAYEAIHVLPAGHTLLADAGTDGRVATVRIRRHWSPPTFEASGGAPFDRAAEELRMLIQGAVAERMDGGTAPTAVWLSGGWDSPTVYGAGRAALRDGRASGSLLPVSMTYPPGDPGREDDLIRQVTDFWEEGTGPLWCDSVPIPLFGDAAAEGAIRELPYAHPYALWTRALASTTAAGGARVALDGSGGDQLFQLSPVYLADLVRRGRLSTARREWLARDMGGLGARRFFRYAILPLLPRLVVRAAEWARGGRPLRSIRGWPLPPWIRADFAAAHDLDARQEPILSRREGESFGALETRWFFESSYSPTVLASQTAEARRAGVELRSPLLDGRVVSHAALRPREERSDRGETKRLLRAAARGLVPDEVLAPRRSRTGTTEGYYRERLLRELPELARCVLPLSGLADLGIAEPSAFDQAIHRSLNGGVREMDVAIFYTLQAELWLRARS